MAATAKSAKTVDADAGAIREVIVSLCRTRPIVSLGLLLAVLSFAPAQPEKAAVVSPLGEARYRAAVKQFDETWAYYRQARIDSYQVYVWSRFVLESRRASQRTRPST